MPINFRAIPLHPGIRFEATYEIAITPWWSIQPDLQWIINPSGVTGSPNALVLGLRTSVAF